MGGHLFWRPMDDVSPEDPDYCRYSGIRMVYTGVDFCIKRNPMLRRHLSGREQNAERYIVLDEFHVLRHFHNRAYAKVDSVGNP